MPVPLIPIIIVVGKVLLWAIAGGVAGALIGLVIAGLIVFITENFRGKKICILGERRVGKTVLFKFLSTGVLHDEYKATTGTIEVKGRAFKLEDIDDLEIKKVMNIKLSDSYDVSGGKDAYSEWEKVYFESDDILYLFRADLIYPMTFTDVVDHFRSKNNENANILNSFMNDFMLYLKSIKYKGVNTSVKTVCADDIELNKHYTDYKSKYLRRMRDDISMINEWQNKSPKPMVLLGTHSDHIPGFDYTAIEFDGKNKGELYDTFRKELSDKVHEIKPKDLHNILAATFTKTEELEYYTARALTLLRRKL